MKSQAKKGKAGRPAGSTKGDAAPGPSKRQKVHMQENLVDNSPGRARTRRHKRN